MQTTSVARSLLRHTAALVAMAAMLSSAGARSAPLRVAVLDFENASADRSLDPWGKGLQSMFITDLSEVVVTGQD